MNEWKEQQAAALDAQASALQTALDELENVHAVLEARGSQKLAGELRGFTAGLRSERAAMHSEARALRATGAGNGVPATTWRRRSQVVVLAEREEETDD